MDKEERLPLASGHPLGASGAGERFEALDREKQMQRILSALRRMRSRESLGFSERLGWIRAFESLSFEQALALERGIQERQKEESMETDGGEVVSELTELLEMRQASLDPARVFDMAIDANASEEDEAWARNRKLGHALAAMVFTDPLEAFRRIKRHGLLEAKNIVVVGSMAVGLPSPESLAEIWRAQGLELRLRGIRKEEDARWFLDQEASLGRELVNQAVNRLGAEGTQQEVPRERGWKPFLPHTNSAAAEAARARYLEHLSGLGRITREREPQERMAFGQSLQGEDRLAYYHWALGSTPGEDAPKGIVVGADGRIFPTPSLQRSRPERISTLPLAEAEKRELVGRLAPIRW
jgi:hypothetical protein